VKVNELLHQYQQEEKIKDLTTAIHAGEQKYFRIEGLAGSSDALLTAALFRNLKKNCLILVNDKEEALYFANDLQTFLPKKDIVLFPASYKRPYQLEEIDNANVLMRAETLNELNHTRSGNLLVITYPEAISEKVINKKSLIKNTLEISIGDKLEMSFIISVLESYDFDRSDFVYEAGQYAVRGGILDVYSFSQEFPFRIEFDGDEIELVSNRRLLSWLSKKPC